MEICNCCKIYYSYLQRRSWWRKRWLECFSIGSSGGCRVRLWPVFLHQSAGRFAVCSFMDDGMFNLSWSTHSGERLLFERTKIPSHRSPSHSQMTLWHSMVWSLSMWLMILTENFFFCNIMSLKWNVFAEKRCKGRVYAWCIEAVIRRRLIDQGSGSSCL